MLNKFIGIGYLGGAPVTRFLDNEKKVANFSLATTEKFTNKAGEKVSRTTWIRISAFGSIAEAMEKNLDKGSLIYVEGRLNSRKYTDRKDVEREVMEVVASYFVLLDKKEIQADDNNIEF